MKKKFLAIMMVLITLFTTDASISIVMASECYYKNEEGVVFTKKEYNKVKEYFNKDAIEQMPESIAEVLMEEEIVDAEYKEVYYEVIEKFDKEGKLVGIKEKQISEMEATQSLKTETYKSSDRKGGLEDTAKYSTSMKKMKLYGVKDGASVVHVTMQNEWVKLPKVRSFDVIAIRFGSAAAKVSADAIHASQIWDNNKISYNPYKNHIRKASQGIGVSMNLSDKAKTSLRSTLSVTFVSGKDPIKIYGSYQHAIKEVSLETSKKYTISKEGYGDVIKFDDDVKDKYDNTKGVNIKLTLDIL